MSMVEEPNLLITEAEIRDALAEINRETLIALDLEGVNLGRSGEITLIQIAINSTREVFLFDLVLAECNIFECGLKDILENVNIKKLMFDCRHDADALSKLYNIQLNSIIDLQLLETTKLINTNTAEEELDRLCGHLHRGNVKGTPPLYTNVHKLPSLQGILETYNLGDASIKATKLGCTTNSQFWKQRPLSVSAIKYAAQDVHILFDAAIAIGSYTNIEQIMSDTALLSASECYANVFRSATDLTYYEHGLLPLGILDNIYVSPTSMTHTRACICCHRNFLKSLYSRNALNKGEPRCDVCRALHIQERTVQQWSNNERNDEYYGSDSDDYGREYYGADDDDYYGGGYCS